MRVVDIHCQRCNKVIARMTPENAAYGRDATTLCMPCSKPRPYLTWVDVWDKQNEVRKKKTVNEQLHSLQKRGRIFRSVIRDSKRHSKFKYK